MFWDIFIIRGLLCLPGIVRADIVELRGVEDFEFAREFCCCISRFGWITGQSQFWPKSRVVEIHFVCRAGKGPVFSILVATGAGHGRTDELHVVP